MRSRPERELAPHEDEGLGRAGGVGADHRALDDLVGVGLQEHVVLVGARLALVAVDDHVGRRGLLEHRPLPADLEAGAAPAEEVGGHDLLGHRLPGHGEGLAQALVAAGVEVGLERPGARYAHAGGDDGVDVGDRHARATRRVGAGHAGGEADVAADPAQRSVGRDLVGQPAGPQVVDELVEGAGADVAEEAPVHRQARGAAAEGDALDLLQGELTVGGGAPGGHAQRRLGVLQQLHPPVEQAGQVGAHRHQVAAHRLGEEHVVEAGGAVDLGPGEAEQLADVLHGLGREPPVLLLGHVEHRDQRRPGPGGTGRSGPWPA